MIYVVIGDSIYKDDDPDIIGVFDDLDEAKKEAEKFFHAAPDIWHWQYSIDVIAFDGIPSTKSKVVASSYSGSDAADYKSPREFGGWQ